MNTSLLKVNDLTVQGADGEVLISNVSFSQGVSERVALVGPNGAGKTTLAKAVAGIRAYNSGLIQLCGACEVKRLLPAELSRLVSYVPQRVEHLPSFTVSEFIDLSGCDESVCHAHTLVSHLLKRSLPELSGGELQRVLIAGAIAQGAKLLVLDEPTASLDPRGRSEVEELVLRNSASGSCDAMNPSPALLLVTHDISLAVRVCERVLIMKEGRLMWDGSPQDPLLVHALEEAYRCSFKRIFSDDDSMPFIVSV